MVRRKELTSLLGLAFFGLTPEYRLHLFSIIHEIVFHGKGGYTFDVVYNMPVWLRKFTFTKIQEFYDKEKESYEKVKGNQQLTPNQAQGPAVKNPSYTTRARK